MKIGIAKQGQYTNWGTGRGNVAPSFPSLLLCRSYRPPFSLSNTLQALTANFVARVGNFVTADCFFPLLSLCVCARLSLVGHRVVSVCVCLCVFVGVNILLDSLA